MKNYAAWVPVAQKRAQQANERIARRRAKLIADIEDGVVRGRIIRSTYPDGRKVEIVKEWKPKGIQHYYDTRTLITAVTNAMDRWEEVYGVRRCFINNRGQLQIRGKHLRRLLKAMPGVKVVGSSLVQEKKE